MYGLGANGANGDLSFNFILFLFVVLELGKVEDEIFKRRRQKDMQWRQRNKANRKRQRYVRL